MRWMQQGEYLVNKLQASQSYQTELRDVVTTLIFDEVFRGIAPSVDEDDQVVNELLLFDNGQEL